MANQRHLCSLAVALVATLAWQCPAQQPAAPTIPSIGPNLDGAAPKAIAIPSPLPVAPTIPAIESSLDGAAPKAISSPNPLPAAPTLPGAGSNLNGAAPKAISSPNSFPVVPTMPGAAPKTISNPSTFPVVPEDRLIKGPDGQWYLVDEAKEQEKAVEEAKFMTLKSFREEVSKMLNVNVKGAGKLQIYGFGRGDGYIGTHKFSPSLEFPFFALPEDPKFKTGPLSATFLATTPGAVGLHSNDSNFTMNARLSRIGFLYTGEKAKWLCDAALEARVELDFYNVVDNVQSSRAMPRIRHGYAKATWGDFSIMIGQNWEIISPLFPMINDDVLMWNVGNLADRRPQLRLNYDTDLGGERRFIFTFGITATDTVARTDFGGDGFFDGEDPGFPGIQARMAFKHPSLVCNKPMEIGVWGLYSADSTNVPIGLSGRSRFNSYVVGGDWQIPLTERIELRGEAWYGQNLDDYRGGVGQGVNTVLGSEIRAWGGWAEVVYKPREWYQLALGATVDDPNNSDVAGTAFNRIYNQTYYVGNRFPVGGGLTFAIDYEFWRTTYVGFDEGTADRIRFWAMMSF